MDVFKFHGDLSANNSQTPIANTSIANIPIANTKSETPTASEIISDFENSLITERQSHSVSRGASPGIPDPGNPGENPGLEIAPNLHGAYLRSKVIKENLFVLK